MKFDIHSTPPTIRQIQSLKKQNESIKTWLCGTLKYGSLLLFVLYLWLVSRSIENEALLISSTVFVAAAAAYLYSIIVDLDRQIGLLEELEEPRDIVTLCKNDALVEGYRQAVVKMGRSLVNAEGLLIEKIAHENQRASGLKKLKGLEIIRET